LGLGLPASNSILAKKGEILVVKSLFLEEKKIKFPIPKGNYQDFQNVKLEGKKLTKGRKK
jgi:hypothetical protein